MKFANFGKHGKKFKRNLISFLFLAALFVCSLFLRIYFARSIYFPDDGSYFHLRQIAYISKKFFPFFYDELSYSGRMVVILPVFDYIMAMLNKFIPEKINYFYTTKIISSLICVVVFLITKSFFRNNSAALFSATGVCFLPLLFGETLHSATPLSFTIILMLLLTYSFIRIKKRESLLPYIAFFLSALFTSTLTLVFIVGIWIFLIFSYTENLENKNRYFELGVFSTSLAIWTYLIVFKEALSINGAAVFWQGMPELFARNALSSLNIRIITYSIGSVSFLAGLYIITKYLFKKKNDFFYIAFSIVLASILLIFLNLISVKNGLIIIGINISMLSGFFVLEFQEFIKKTNFAKLKNFMLFFIFGVLILNNILLCISYSNENIKNFPGREEVMAMEYLKENSEKDSAVLSKIKYGNLITYYAKRKNVIDNNFLLVNDAQTRYYDVERFYKTIYAVDAIKIMNKYNAKYFIVDNEIPKYLNDEECFKLIYNNTIKVYKLSCTV
ncbi:MAG: hypothetical protein ACP5OZ_01585 [Candidatus Woesearchaeota archaeon]